MKGPTNEADDFLERYADPELIEPIEGSRPPRPDPQPVDGKWLDSLRRITARRHDPVPPDRTEDDPLRYGQALFNDAYRVAPDLVDRIRGTDADPFYQDERVPQFLAALITEARAERNPS